jgi:hypothetical protein
MAWFKGGNHLFLITSMELFLEFGDFGIAELFLLSLKWLVVQRYDVDVFA